MKNNLYSPIGQILIKYIKCKKTLYNLDISCKFGYLIADEKIKLEYAKKLGWRGCVEQGYLNLIKLLDKYNIEGYTKYIVDLACINGNLKIVKWFHRKGGYVVSTGCRNYAVILASINGHLDVVKYVHKKVKKQKQCNINTGCGKYYVEFIEWLFENKIEKNITNIRMHIPFIDCRYIALDYASRYGYLDVLHWVHMNHGGYLSSNALIWASEKGHLDVVEYLEVDIDWDEIRILDRYSYSARHDYIKYARERSRVCSVVKLLRANRINKKKIKYLYTDNDEYERLEYI